MTQFSFNISKNCKTFSATLSDDGTITINYTVEEPVVLVEKDSGTVLSDYDKQVAMAEYHSQNKIAAIAYLRKATKLSLLACKNAVDEWIAEEDGLRRDRLYQEQKADFEQHRSRYDYPDFDEYNPFNNGMEL